MCANKERESKTGQQGNTLHVRSYTCNKFPEVVSYFQYNQSYLVLKHIVHYIAEDTWKQTPYRRCQHNQQSREGIRQFMDDVAMSEQAKNRCTKEQRKYKIKYYAGDMT